MKKMDLENEKKLFFSLREVATLFEVNTSLLKHWETEFKNINPKKTSGGIRQYTREDIQQITLVYHLVKVRGLTLDGAKQALKNSKNEEEKKLIVVERLEKIKAQLLDMQNELDALQ